jgi:AcrR family transcriptional regulator
MTRNPSAVKASLIEAAITEFGEKGLAGARVDAIAAATETSKRMIYYYFQSKEGLYLAALEESYRRVRSLEREVDVDHLPPADALKVLTNISFDHHLTHETYIRMVMSENMNRGRFLAQSSRIHELNRPVIDLLRRVYERGVQEGVFREGLDPVDIHANISALAFFNMSNRYTFGLIFKLKTQSPTYIAQRRETITQTILRYVQA